MAIMKRFGGAAGLSHPGGSKQAQDGGTVCPHCQRQTRLIPQGGKMVCQLCGKAPGER